MITTRILALLLVWLVGFSNQNSSAQTNAFSIPGALEQPDDSLGTMVRQRSDELSPGGSSQLDQKELGPGVPTAALLGSRERAEINGHMDGQRSDQQAMGASDPDREDEARGRSAMRHLLQLKKPVAEIELDSRPLHHPDHEQNGQVPDNQAVKFAGQPPLIMISALGVSPSPPQRYTIDFCHRPLYYEQRNLERCGKGCDYFQNTISGVQFLVNTMCLPYHVIRQRPHCRVPSSGDCLTCQPFPCDP